MIKEKGIYYFGFLEGTPYGEKTDEFEDFKAIKNEIDKKTVIRHMESLDIGYASPRTKDLFTGEEFQVGIIHDGPFVFPVDFLRYYKSQDIGIPYEYEAYLKTILK